MMGDDSSLAVLKEILNWTRAASFHAVKALLTEALPESKTRLAYQMSDGTNTGEQIRVACKMSPNAVVALGQKCVSMGLMETRLDKKRVRLFDLNDFGLMPPPESTGGKPQNETQS